MCSYIRAQRIEFQKQMYSIVSEEKQIPQNSFSGSKIGLATNIT